MICLTRTPKFHGNPTTINRSKITDVTNAVVAVSLVEFSDHASLVTSLYFRSPVKHKYSSFASSGNLFYHGEVVVDHCTWNMCMCM